MSGWFFTRKGLSAAGLGSFKTITPSSGTSPVATSLTDVLTINGGTGITVTGNAGTDTIVIAATGAGDIASIGITIDGGGSAITTGIKGYIEVPYPCTINRATMLADQSGSAVVDIWKAAYASYPPTVSNTITAAALPTISATNKSQDSTLTGWTVTVAAGDILGFNVNSASTITRLHLILKVTKT